SNVYNTQGKLYVLDTNDIISLADTADFGSGLRPVCVQMIRYRPAATGGAVGFQTLDRSKAVTVAIAADSYTVTSTYRITDVSSGGVFSGAAAGMWANIKHSSSGYNEGWFLITAVDGSSHYIDVAYGRALNNDIAETYTIDIYTPENTVILVSETGDSGAQSIASEVIDFGPGGRIFENLSMYAIVGGTADVYVK
ncbi:unnamed protein product, partial [marine sediment metagenome]